MRVALGPVEARETTKLVVASILQEFNLSCQVVIENSVRSYLLLTCRIYPGHGGAGINVPHDPQGGHRGGPNILAPVSTALVVVVSRKTSRPRTPTPPPGARGGKHPEACGTRGVQNTRHLLRRPFWPPARPLTLLQSNGITIEARGTRLQT